MDEADEDLACESDSVSDATSRQPSEATTAFKKPQAQAKSRVSQYLMKLDVNSKLQNKAIGIKS